MARKPNYEFERRERDRLKAIKVAEKARGQERGPRTRPAGEAGEAPPADVEPTPEKT